MVEQLCQADQQLTATRHGHRRQAAAYGGTPVQPARTNGLSIPCCTHHICKFYISAVSGRFKCDHEMEKLLEKGESNEEEGNITEQRGGILQEKG